MSFFEEDDEPTRRQPRPRRAAPTGGPNPDPQTLWARRGVAIGVGVLVLLVLVLAIDSCRDTSRKNSLKDYNRSIAALVQQSDADVGANFIEQLGQAGNDSAGDLQTSISGLRVQSETLLDQAEKVSTPDPMTAAQRSLLIAFELRRDGLDFIAKRIASAVGDSSDTADTALEEIAGQMQAFLASDVLIQTRVTPVVKQALDDAEIGGQTVVATDGFLPSLSWLQPEYVAEQLGTQLSEGGKNRKPNEPTGPGKHGTGLVSVSIGDVTLNPGEANRIAVTSNPAIAVKFANQGDNDEFDIKVSVTLKGPGKAIKASKTIDTVVKGVEATANIQLPSTPAVGQAYSMTVNVATVPGEVTADNNKQTYNVFFQPA